MTEQTQKRVRLSDVAAAAGVSRTLVGHVLLGSTTNVGASHDTTLRVRTAAQRLGYRPNLMARQLKGKRSKMLGALVSATMNTASHERVMATEAEAYRRGYMMMIGQVHPVPGAVDRYVEEFIDRGAEAILYMDQIFKPFPQSLVDRPNVIYTLHPELPDVHCVELDRCEVGRLAVRHLASIGRKRIGLAMAHRPSKIVDDRLEGYRKELAAQGLVFNPSLAWLPDPLPDPTLHADKGIAKLVEEGKIDGLVASSDQFAIALIRALKRRGLRVPEDVAVVGYGNLDVATVCEPELTTIDHCHADAAKALLDMVEERIAHGDLPVERRYVHIMPKLVVRQSA